MIAWPHGARCSRTRIDRKYDVSLPLPGGSPQPSQAVRCPVCGGIGGPELARVEGYTVHECVDCGLRFSNPMKHPGSEWYRDSPLYKHRVTKSLRIPTWVVGRDWRFQTFLALKIRPGGRCLDVGCGTGEFMRLARARGYQVTGVDVDEEAIQVARERDGLADAHALSVDEVVSDRWQRRFDVICLFDVLEHLEDPVAVIRRLGNLLAPGGSVVFTVPGSQRWPPLFDPHVDSPPHHLTLWTSQSVEKCISAANLRLSAVMRSPLVGESLWPHALWRVRPLLLLPIFGALLKGVAHFVLAPPAARLLSLVPRAGGFTLMGVGTRPDESSFPGGSPG